MEMNTHVRTGMVGYEDVHFIPVEAHQLIRLDIIQTI